MRITKLQIQKYIKKEENNQKKKKKKNKCEDLAGIRKTVAWAAYSGREAANKIIEKIK